MASPEELLCLEAMVTVLAKPASPGKNHAATAPCKAILIWSPLPFLLIPAPYGKAKACASCNKLGRRSACDSCKRRTVPTFAPVMTK